MRKLIFFLSVVTVLCSLPLVHASDSPAVPAGFKATLLASGLNQPKGIVSALHRAGDGPFGHDLYVAESGANQIVTVDKGGAGAAFFASTGSFPVGVAFYGGTYDKYLYVGVAYGGGVTRVDPGGTVSPFALAGKSIAGLDYGRGAYGPDLYAGEWPIGNIWRVDSSGNSTPFSSVPATQTRYLKFSHGGWFGTFLFYTDINSGDIYRVAPDGSASVFASTGSPCLEGLDFSPGGAFGHYLYAGDVCTGDIFQVDQTGKVKLWASGFEGVADIHFEPVAQGPGHGGGFTMYLVTGAMAGEVWAISR